MWCSVCVEALRYVCGTVCVRVHACVEALKYFQCVFDAGLCTGGNS